MKIKKIPLWTTLVLFILIAFQFNGLTSAATNDQPEWKTIYGSIWDIADKTQKKNQLETLSPFHTINFSKLVENASFWEYFYEKNRIKYDIPQIKKMIESEPSEYSGHYYVEDTGTVVVQITKDSEELKSKIQDLVENKDKIDFQITKFSWDDIQKAKKKIRENVIPGTVRALIPDVQNNKLIVALDEDTTISEETITKLIEESDILEFTTLPASSLKTETDNTNYGSQFPMGSKIGGNYQEVSENSYSYSVCTAGYFGVNQNNQDVLVTSGHCQPKDTINAWYQPTWNSSTIGNFTFRTTSLGDGSNASSDAGYITLDSNFSGRPRVPYPSTSNMAMITGVYVSDTPGETIYLRGANSGTTTSGKIAYSNVDIYWGKNGYGYKHNEVLATGYSSIGGDSGGPILTNYAYDSSLQGWTFDLAGTHTGVVTLTSTQSPIPTGTYKVYEPIWTTYSDLNLSGVTIISK